MNADEADASREAGTRLLHAIDAGDPNAADQLLPLVYEELRFNVDQSVRLKSGRSGRSGAPTKASVITEVRMFEKASLAGDYYESFNVNSRNYTQKFAGTTAWIAQCRRLLD